MNKFTVVKKQNLQEMDLKESKHVKWAATKKDEYCESVESSSINGPILASSSSSSKSSSPPFSSSSLSSSSSDLADDASSFTSNSSPPSCGPLYELADLMAQLPIKRGLSKFYHGKSQSFASLLNVKSVEDLAKKEMSCRRRMKSCKSYGGNLSHQKFGPKAAIGKRTPKTLLFSPPFGTKGETSKSTARDTW